MSRTESSLRNLYTAFAGQTLAVVISFVARKIFLYYLNEEYLGLNGLFSNMLTIFSLVELGIGPAINFALYKPLAEHNYEQVKSLMALYKKFYRLIGCCIAGIGILFTPLYKLFLSETPNLPHLTLIYWLFLANTVISYFYSYKQALIICDEKRYIATTFHYIFFFLMNVIQIVLLIATHSYILFLFIQVIFTFFENVNISLQADRIYPYLREKNVERLSQETLDGIKKNVYAMVCHKIGGMIVLSTDNLILSKFVGLTAVGIYSNYYLITNALNKIIGQVFTSLTASIGNLNASEGIENRYKLQRTFERVFFLNFWIYGFSACCLWGLFNPFISLWLGDNLLFNNFTVLIIVVNYYLYGIRRTAIMYREATGAFYFDRYKPLVESAINIIVSIILAQRIGTAGVFLGTIISTLLACILVEPYVVYKHVLNASFGSYCARFLKYAFATAAAGALITLIGHAIRIQNTVLNFVVRCVLCAIVPNFLFLVCFFRTNEFRFFVEFLTNGFKRLAKFSSK